MNDVALASMQMSSARLAMLYYMSLHPQPGPVYRHLRINRKKLEPRGSSFFICRLPAAPERQKRLCLQPKGIWGQGGFSTAAPER